MILKFYDWFWLFALLVIVSPKTGAAEDNRPNIVWLISEDNSKHYLKLFDEHGVSTPNIESLASTGIVFDRAFSNAPVCSVARTTLITGVYAPRLGTQFHRRNKLVKLPADTPMFPQLLRSAGYYAANNAKKDYNAVEANEVWDASSKKASWRNAAKGQPFFYKQTLAQSHEGSLHFNPKQVKSKPTDFDASKVFVAPYHPQTELFRYTNAKYRDRMTTIDKSVGKILAGLSDDGLLDDTFIFYFGDHGGVLPGSKGYLYETGLHVPLVVHVPKNFQSLVPKSWRQPCRTNSFVEFVDFSATVLNLAGIKVPDGYDGKPFLGKGISDSSLDSRETAFGYADRFDEKYDLVRSLRKGNFKYIRNFEPTNFDGLNNNYRYKMAAYREWRELYHSGKLNETQSRFFETKPVEMLFDLDSDPHEINNLAKDPQFQTRLVAMRNELTERLIQMNDLSFLTEREIVRQGCEDPAGFSKQNKSRIEKLIRIANLQLQSLENVKDELEILFGAEDPLVRYWAINVCIAFGESAAGFKDRLLEMANSDDDGLVAACAAQYLAINKLADPAPLFTRVLKKKGMSEDLADRVELAMVLNKVVLLTEGYGFKFDLKREWFQKKGSKDTVQRLVGHLLKSK